MLNAYHKISFPANPFIFVSQKKRGGGCFIGIFGKFDLSVCLCYFPGIEECNIYIPDFNSKVDQSFKCWNAKS